MPIPFLFMGVAAVTAAVGAGKSIKAAIDTKDAAVTNELANDIVNDAKKAAEKNRNESGQAINDLGERKIKVLNESVTPFIESFEKLHNVELSNSNGLDELGKLKVDKQFFDELKELGTMASSIGSGVAGGAVLGAVTAFGAYGAAMTFGACATTGTLISTLSGAAATNATLAFLGGGALSVGGLGIAGGTAVLGGLVAGPALAVMGFVVGAKASANKDRAYANYAKANEFQEEMHTVRVMCNAIRRRANMYERLLMKLDAVLTPLKYNLDRIIDEYGADYAKYGEEQKNTVAAGLSTIVAIKAVLDTPILTEDGKLTEESANISDSVKYALGDMKND